MAAPSDNPIKVGANRFKSSPIVEETDETDGPAMVSTGGIFDQSQPLIIDLDNLPKNKKADAKLSEMPTPTPVSVPPSPVPTPAKDEEKAAADIPMPVPPVPADGGMPLPVIDIAAEGENKNPQAASFLGQLVAAGALTDEQSKKLLLESATTGRAIEDIIIERSLVSEEKMTSAKAAFYNIPFVKLKEVGVSPEALALLSKPIAERYNLIPFDLDRDKKEFSVAMANPLDLNAIEFVEKKVGMRVKVFASEPSVVAEAIANNYAQNLSAEVTAALRETTPQPTRTIDIRQLGEVIREAPIAKIVSTILEYAIKSRASDVHIEPQTDRVRVRYRIDGILHERLILPINVHDALVSRIKILSGMKIDEKRLPQDGRFNFRAGGEEVDLRVSSLPTVLGEKVVMRLLKKSGGVPTLGDLGLRGKALKNLDDAILRPHGIILVCGPTGSGKTTTLYAVLSKINTTRVNIVTLEDPVEYQIFGVNQVQVNPQAGLTFASGLRSFLRQDPNIIMVGEIRDNETSDLAIQAALTGHLVFSTLHTNDASGALPRLLDFGMEPFLLASSMTAVVAQRVVRKVCPNCKSEYEAAPEVLEDIKKVLGALYPTGKTFKLVKGAGCSECGDSGYQGRIGVFEVIPVSEAIGKLILERASAGEIQTKAVEEGMVSMKQDGYLKAIEGITTIEEVLRVAQE